MQAKSRSSWVCTVHLLCYSLPWLLLLWGGIVSSPALVLILVQHWLQDRFSLHLRWMEAYGQTKPQDWPVGPLCVDQSWHLVWVALVLASGV